MIDAATTLGDVVTSTPALAAELERRGRDYCCGDDRTLADACTDRGLDLDATIDELRAAAVTTADEAPAWATMVVAELVDHLEATHHRDLWDELPRLSALVDKIVAVHGDRHREVPAVADRLAELRADLEPHLLDEERVAFPAVRQIVTSGEAPPVRHGPVSGRIAALLAEHDRVGELLAMLRELTDGFQPPAHALRLVPGVLRQAGRPGGRHPPARAQREQRVVSSRPAARGAARRGAGVRAPADEGGEPACWAHLFEDQRPDITTRDDVRRLVVAFYRDVAMDDVLGPVFAAAHVDWSVHIPKLVDFWAWQLLGEPGYERNPLRAHEPVHARTPFGGVHYQRWLDLFDTTLDGLFAGPTAQLAKRRGRRMASAMRRLLDSHSAGGEEPVGIQLTQRGDHSPST